MTKKINPLYSKRLAEEIENSPFPKHLKMKVDFIENTTCGLSMEPGEFRNQPFGIVHGGNIATMIDTATFWACYFSMKNDEDALTSVDLKLNYLRPVKDKKIKCIGSMIKAGRTLFYAQATVYDSDEKVVAHGTSTIMRMKGLGFKWDIPMFQGDLL